MLRSFVFYTESLIDRFWEMQKWFRPRGCQEEDSVADMAPTVAQESSSKVGSSANRSEEERLTIHDLTKGGTSTMRATEDALTETLQLISLREQTIREKDEKITDLQKQIKQKDVFIQDLKSKVDKLQAVMRVHARASCTTRPTSLVGIYSPSSMCGTCHLHTNDLSTKSKNKDGSSYLHSLEEPSASGGAVTDGRVKRNAISAEPSADPHSHPGPAPEAFPKPKK